MPRSEILDLLESALKEPDPKELEIVEARDQLYDQIRQNQMDKLKELQQLPRFIGEDPNQIIAEELEKPKKQIPQQIRFNQLRQKLQGY
jgi:hypothetical protein